MLTPGIHHNENIGKIARILWVLFLFARESRNPEGSRVIGSASSINGVTFFAAEVAKSI